MLTGKQRSYLKKLAQSIDPAVYIGKYGLTDAVIESVNENLTANELVKVKIQDGSELQPKDVCQYMAEKLKAEYVQSIGKKFVLFRPAKDKEKRKIVLPK